MGRSNPVGLARGDGRGPSPGAADATGHGDGTTVVETPPLWLVGRHPRPRTNRSTATRRRLRLIRVSCEPCLQGIPAHQRTVGMMASPVQVFESTWIAKAVVMFFLRPTAYVELATQYDAGYVLTHSADLRPKWEAGEFDPLTEEHRATVVNRASTIRCDFFSAGVLVFTAGLTALLVRAILRGWPDAPPSAPNALQIGGAGILLWATVWQIGSGVRSFGGETLSELVHNAIFRLMAFLGTCLFVLAYFW